MHKELLIFADTQVVLELCPRKKKAHENRLKGQSSLGLQNLDSNAVYVNLSLNL